MDPDVTLGTALLAARALADGPLHDRAVEAHPAALAEAVLSLDEWIVKGGYLPARWRGTDASGIPAWHRPGAPS